MKQKISVQTPDICPECNAQAASRDFSRFVSVCRNCSHEWSNSPDTKRILETLVEGETISFESFSEDTFQVVRVKDEEVYLHNDGMYRVRIDGDTATVLGKKNREWCELSEDIKLKT